MLIHLKNRALIKLTGTESESFLQAQISNDISRLDNSSVQLNAYCQHQGKILALFWVIRAGDDFLLSFPLDLLDLIKNRLQMFILRSDVLIENVTDKYIQVGLIDENRTGAYKLIDQLSLMLVDSKDIEEFAFSSQEYWDKACIDSLIPEVNSQTTENFVPQMLNLDINEIGVSFTKGCYPGQEVVARLHYLGKAKRRLFSFKSESEMQVGDSLYCAFSNAAKARGNRYKGSGIVVSKVQCNSQFYCLATLETELKDNKITLNNEHGPTLEILNNE